MKLEDKFILFICNQLAEAFASELYGNNNLEEYDIEQFLNTAMTQLRHKFITYGRKQKQHSSKTSDLTKLSAELRKIDGSLVIKKLKSPEYFHRHMLPLKIENGKLKMTALLRYPNVLAANVVIWATGHITNPDNENLSTRYHYIAKDSTKKHFHTFYAIAHEDAKLPKGFIGIKSDKTINQEKLFFRFNEKRIAALCPFCFDKLDLNSSNNFTNSFCNPLVCSECFHELAGIMYYEDQNFLMEIINYTDRMIFVDPEDPAQEILKNCLFNVYTSIQRNYFENNILNEIYGYAPEED